ncbi:hypothetical protein VTK56DRAFT_6540 [Thermocarpiscus australiensis]
MPDNFWSRPIQGPQPRPDQIPQRRQLPPGALARRARVADLPSAADAGTPTSARAAAPCTPSAGAAAPAWGKNIVNDETFVFGAAALWAFRAAPTAQDLPAHGVPVPLDRRAANSHVILEPSPFQLYFQPRSRERARLVLEGYQSMLGKLRVMGGRGSRR